MKESNKHIAELQEQVLALKKELEHSRGGGAPVFSNDLKSINEQKDKPEIHTVPVEESKQIKDGPSSLVFEEVPLNSNS